MGKITGYKDLIVWQKAIELVTEIFLLTDPFPRSELYGIVSQMRKAVISIPSNIAEGYGRKSPKEFSQGLSVSYGSALEIETQIIVSKKLKLAPLNSFERSDSLLLEVIKMLHTILYRKRRNEET